MINHLPQNIFRKDCQGRFTFANEGFCAALGKSLAEILGKTDADLFPAELAQKYQRDDQEVMTSARNFEAVEEHVTRGRVHLPIAEAEQRFEQSPRTLRLRRRCLPMRASGVRAA